MFERDHFQPKAFLEGIANLHPAEQRRFIIEKMSELNRDLAEVKIQLDLAKAEVLTEGVYADPKWFAKAVYVVRIKGQQVQALQTALGSLPRVRLPTPEDEARVKAKRTFEGHFIKAAKAILPGETYRSIIERARQTMQAEMNACPESEVRVT